MLNTQRREAHKCMACAVPSDENQSWHEGLGYKEQQEENGGQTSLCSRFAMHKKLARAKITLPAMPARIGLHVDLDHANSSGSIRCDTHQLCACQVISSGDTHMTLSQQWRALQLSQSSMESS